MSSSSGLAASRKVFGTCSVIPRMRGSRTRDTAEGRTMPSHKRILRKHLKQGHFEAMRHREILFGPAVATYMPPSPDPRGSSWDLAVGGGGVALFRRVLSCCSTDAYARGGRLGAAAPPR